MSSGTRSQSDAKQNSSASGQQDTAQIASDKLQQAGQHYVAEPARDMFSVLKDYARDKPDVAAMWCFGLGVVVGWKLRG